MEIGDFLRSFYVQYKRLGIILTLTTLIFGSSRVFKLFVFDKKVGAVEAPVAETKSPAPAIATKPEISETQLTLASGANVEKLLIGFGADKTTTCEISKAFSKYVPNKSLKSGLVFNVTYIRDEKGLEIKSFSAQPSYDKKVVVSKNNKEYVAKEEVIKLTPVVHVFEGSVNSSFYSAALRAGVPSKFIQEAVEVLSYVVNFQHGIQAGASFKILCEGLSNEKGQIVKIKQLRCVTLQSGGQEHKLFAFNQGGKTRFFNTKGESVVRSLLQTPLNASRLQVTSGFGMRRHPIMGYSKQHKGVDFGAPIGTPVLAAGEGKIIAAGWSGGYGNRVHIRHAGGYETVYAHLKCINKNIKPGALVSQRQIIGAVGMTGMTTGPHLHFEVIQAKRHINPMKVQSLPTVKLTGIALKKFESLKSTVQGEMMNFVRTKAVTIL